MENNNELKTLYKKVYPFKDQIGNLESNPFIISIDGVHFKKITKQLEKPFSNHFNDIMVSISKSLSEEIHGIFLSFVVGDEIILVGNPKNDNIWCGGDSSKIISMVSGLCSHYFKCYVEESPLKDSLKGQIGIFNVKNITNITKENLVSYLIWKQDASRRVYDNLGTVLIKTAKYSKSKNDNLVLRNKFQIFYDFNFKFQKSILKDVKYKNV